MTSSQQRCHFLRQVKGRRQTGQIFWGRLAFLMCRGMAIDCCGAQVGEGSVARGWGCARVCGEMSETGDEIAEGVHIGMVSRMTGLSAETLRAWERRYGFPQPERTQGGQRLYTMETVERLRLIARALEEGIRPGQAVRLSPEVLSTRLGRGAGTRAERVRAIFAEKAAPAEVAAVLQTLMEATRAMDGARLEGCLRREWYNMGPVAFLEQVAARFVWEVGEAWFEGSVSVAEEHLASERLRDFLVSQWRPLSDAARGPRVLCATLSGEQHVLGLHMAACLAALAGYKVLFLGANMPRTALVEAATKQQARALFVSVSLAAHGGPTRQELAALRAALGEDTALIVGGAGAPGGVGGCLRMSDLFELTAWLAAEAARRDAIA